jgi:2-iminobutanoate/2-iminopropanoate deaminase
VRRSDETTDHFEEAAPAQRTFLARDGSITGLGDVEAQTRQVCENLKAAVEEAGGTLDDICRVDVYVRNMEHFERIHKVRREYFTGSPPASTMVEVNKFTSPDYLIEINAIAVLPNG